MFKSRVSAPREAPLHVLADIQPYQCISKGTKTYRRSEERLDSADRKRRHLKLKVEAHLTETLPLSPNQESSLPSGSVRVMEAARLPIAGLQTETGHVGKLRMGGCFRPLPVGRTGPVLIGGHR